MRLNSKLFWMPTLAVMAFATAAGAQDLPNSRTPTEDDPPTRQGTRGANFLQIGVSARGNAMGGALAGLVEGPTAWYWNPAGAAATEHFAVVGSRQDLYADLDISHNYVGASLPFLGGTIGASFTVLSSGDIQRTTEGSPTGASAVLGSTFSWTSTAIGLGYARRLTDRLDIGGQLKYVSEGISDASVKWGALDLGTQFRTGIYGVTIGATIQNVGPSSEVRGSAVQQRINSDDVAPFQVPVEFNTVEMELPTLFRFSIANDLYGRVGSVLGQGNGEHMLAAAMEFSDAIDTDVQLAFGGEYSFRNLVFVRGGKRFYNDDRATGRQGMFGLSGGLGVRLPFRERSLRFDYAYTSMGDLENVQVFTFEFGQ